jgi:cation diffusion facilitator CzcD-associated flavoprotein CzcO
VAERCAIVGGGLAGLVGYAALRQRGVDAEDIAVFGVEPDPAGPLRRRSAAIRQRYMRSESDGHCHPASFPGLAVGSARAQRSLLPLLRSACNRYRPTVGEFFAHVDELREKSGWDGSLRRVRVERITATVEGFRLDRLGTYRHVLVAPGHPGLAVPAQYAGDARVVHSYEPHDYADRVAVVGAGMAAAMEWLNALEAGASVVSVRRRNPARRPLSVPRSMFSRRGLAGFHATAAAARMRVLEQLAEPSYPHGMEWDAPLATAARTGRFRVVQHTDGAEQVICATGFSRGFQHSPLLSRLVDDHSLETAGGWIVLAPDSTVPRLTDAGRTLALAGAPGQWAFPGADTVVGAKYVARRFARRVQPCRTA